MHKPTRRTLLRSMVAAAGSAGVYRTMDALGMLGPATAHAAAPALPPRHFSAASPAGEPAVGAE